VSGQPLCVREGGGDGDVVVTIALHKFGLEEKRKGKKKKKLILLLPIEAGGLCAHKECTAGEGMPVCARGCCPR